MSPETSKDGSKVLRKPLNEQGQNGARWHGAPVRRAVDMRGLIAYTGLSRRQLYRVIAQGYLRPYRPPGIASGRGGKNLFDLVAVDAWMNAGQAPVLEDRP